MSGHLDEIARRCGSDAEKTAEDRSQTGSSGANRIAIKGIFIVIKGIFCHQQWVGRRIRAI